MKTNYLKCRKCGKRVKKFPKSDWGICRKCLLEYYAKWRREKKSVKRNYYPQGGPNICKVCHIPLNKTNWYPSQRGYGTKICMNCQSKVAKKYRELNEKKLQLKRREQKIKVLNLLGGCFCVNCGCDEIDLLEINHKSGGGTRERKNDRKGSTVMSSILHHGRKTEDLDVRCRLCNALYSIELKNPEIASRFSVKWRKI